MRAAYARRRAQRKNFVTIPLSRESEAATIRLMKLLFSLVLFATCAFAVEIQQVPAEQAVKIARKVCEALGTPSDAPFSVEANAEKAVGIRATGDTGLLAIPDRKLTVEALANAGKEPLAIGQLWMRNVVPAVNDVSADPALLRTVNVRDGEHEAKVETYFLGVSKTETGALELGLYAKEKAPLVKVPLVKTDASTSAVPLALDGHKEGENTGLLVVTILGSYKADVTVTKPRE